MWDWWVLHSSYSRRQRALHVHRAGPLITPRLSLSNTTVCNTSPRAWGKADCAVTSVQMQTRSWACACSHRAPLGALQGFSGASVLLMDKQQWTHDYSSALLMLWWAGAVGPSLDVPVCEYSIWLYVYGYLCHFRPEQKIIIIIINNKKVDLNF